MNTRDTRYLDAESAQAIQLELTPLEPSSAAKLALRARILERARNAQQTDLSPHQTVRDEEGDWQEIAPLVEMKVLFRNAQAEAVMYRLHPGAELASHEHPTDEECMMLEGEMWIGDLRLRAGDFHLGCQGVGHAGIRSPKGALLYVRRGIVAGAA